MEKAAHQPTVRILAPGYKLTQLSDWCLISLTLYSPSGHENKRLCGFGDVLKGLLGVKSNNEPPCTSVDRGEAENTLQSSLNDGDISSGLSTKQASATRLSSKNTGQQDLERSNDD